MASFKPRMTRAERAMEETLEIPKADSPVMGDLIDSEDEKVISHRKTMYEKFNMKKIMGDIVLMHQKNKIKDLINTSVKTKFLFQLMR